MNTKILALLPIMLLILPAVVAQEADVASNAGPDTDVQGDPGVTPDSPLYGIDVALDNIKLAMAKDSESKAKLGLEIAQERLLEIQAMGKKGKVDAVARAEKEHGKAISEAESGVAGLQDGAKAELGLRGIKLGMSNHIAALEKVRAKIQANPNIPPDVKAKLETKFQNLESKAEELKAKVENKKSQVEIKLKAEGFEQKLKVKTDGQMPESVTALVNQLAATLTQPGKVEIEIEKKPDQKAKVEVKGALTSEQQALVDQITAGLSNVSGNVKISLDWEFELEKTDTKEKPELENVKAEGAKNKTESGKEQAKSAGSEKGSKAKETEE